MIIVIIELENFDLQLEYSYYYCFTNIIAKLSFLNSDMVVLLSYGKHFLANTITC